MDAQNIMKFLAHVNISNCRYARLSDWHVADLSSLYLVPVEAYNAYIIGLNKRFGNFDDLWNDALVSKGLPYDSCRDSVQNPSCSVNSWNSNKNTQDE